MKPIISISRALGALIKAARTKAGMNQEELAAELRWPQKKISLIENGRQPADVDELYDIARALGVNSTELFREAVKQSGRPISPRKHQARKGLAKP